MAPNRLILVLLITLCSFGQTVAVAQDEAEPEQEEAGQQEGAEQQEETAEEQEENDGEPEEDESDQGAYEVDTNDDDTADIDTASTVDTVSDARRFVLSGDFRPLANHAERHNRDGENVSETVGQFRLRLKARGRAFEKVQYGIRLAGRCATDDCDLEWVLQKESPSTNGLADGQFTFDELYLHFFRQELYNLTVGRQQTRFVLRGGVFSRSLDRNDSNNTRVTWTDGFHFTFRQLRGWEAHVIVQDNAADGTGSIRRGPLDFDYSSAGETYFVGLEKTEPLGPIVQRSIGISYLPNSLLKDGTLDGRREDYMAYVVRLAARWPLGSEGMRLRAGMELGYAPETHTSAAAGIDAEVDGLAWNVVVSLMDFKSGHSIGINYGETGTGWLLSPNFRQNEESFEVRYVWRPKNFPMIDARIRWREDIEQEIASLRKREVFDAFLRMTWQFN
jgi:hypothetical protein